MSFNDFGTAVKALGMSLTDPQIDDLINDMKLIGNESIDLPEFISLLSFHYRDVNIKEELEEGFALFDRK